MVYEYEFRLIVVPDRPLLEAVSRAISETLPSCDASIRRRRVVYAKPHFRLRDGLLQVKRTERRQAVYHDRLWFRWVESLELPFERWRASDHVAWTNACGNYQNGFVVESRREIHPDRHVQIYTFDGQADRGIVFEWELGEFESRRDTLCPPPEALASLEKYRSVYDLFRNHPYPPSPRNGSPCSRKPVIPIAARHLKENELVAYKHDGTFCLVYSFPDVVKVRCEGNAYRVLRSVTLGDGVVFAGEKLKDGTIVLLDVYRMHGMPVSPCCRRAVLKTFLRKLPLPEGFEVQKYRDSVQKLALPPPQFCDGWIIHDVVLDKVYKVKNAHTLDVVYVDGNFELSDGTKMPCRETKRTMKNGQVYEIDMEGNVLKRRRDRFTGNTVQQLKRIRTAARMDNKD